MTLSRLRFQAIAWIKEVASTRALSIMFGVAGAYFLLYKMAALFLEDTPIHQLLRQLWWLGFLVGGTYALWVCRPRTSITHRLSGRDVTLEIAVGDVLSFTGDLVIGSNTTFDTKVSKRLISKESVQGQFLARYYGSDSDTLDGELRDQLDDLSAEVLAGDRVGKSARYELGTVVQVHPDRRHPNRRAYLLAIADINEGGVARGDFEGLKRALAALWVYVGARGAISPLVAPVLGTGFSRLSEKREEVVREMFRSFVAACSDGVFTPRFTVVLGWQDVVEHNISIEELGLFVRHLCLYAEHSRADVDPIGAPV